jgi:putative membrane protein
MIEYDPHQWWSHFCDIRGSMLREIFARVLSCVAWSAVVVLIDKHVHDVSIPTTVHGFLGVALGLLLVFRTNASYDRYWEGRRMWGSIINESRNLGRAAAVYLADAPVLRRNLARWTAVFAYAAMHRLRDQRTLGLGARLLSDEETAEVLSLRHFPTEVARRITQTLREAREQGLITDIQQMTLDQNVQLLIDYLGACERIHTTPLPFAYMVHLRRALILYCYTLPFALVHEHQWTTVAETLLVAYIFFGIEEIGVEIEGPFGSDENDLPLERFCALIEQNVMEQAGEAKAWPSGEAAGKPA